MRPLQFDSAFTVRANSDLRAAIVAAAERKGASASDWVHRALASIVAVQPSTAPPVQVRRQPAQAFR
jgi:hypothetical protein